MITKVIFNTIDFSQSMQFASSVILFLIPYIFFLLLAEWKLVNIRIFFTFCTFKTLKKREKILHLEY